MMSRSEAVARCRRAYLPAAPGPRTCPTAPRQLDRDNDSHSDSSLRQLASLPAPQPGAVQQLCRTAIPIRATVSRLRACAPTPEVA